MRRFLRDNAFLVAAVALPVVVATFYLLVTAVPRWTVPPPHHDLVFQTHRYGPSPQVNIEFVVEEGTLQARIQAASSHPYNQRPTLWLFDHETMNVREIPVNVPDLAPGESARTVVVEALAGRRVLGDPRAPDGYEVESPTRRSPGLVGEIFGMSRYDHALSLVKDGRVVPVPAPAGHEYGMPQFIGWLVNETER